MIAKDFTCCIQARGNTRSDIPELTPSGPILIKERKINIAIVSLKTTTPVLRLSDLEI